MTTLTSIIDFFLQGRGERGVFDLEELVDILKGEKVAKSSSWFFLTIRNLLQLRDIVVIRVPEERQYCDFMIVATGRNTRHVKWVSLLINCLSAIFFNILIYLLNSTLFLLDIIL